MDKNDWLKQNARQLRKDMPDCERILWSHISAKKLLGYRFNRQVIYGDYIVDFVCKARKLIVELDGEQHFSAKNEFSDKKRDKFLRSLGFRVFHFGNNEVLGNLNMVLDTIVAGLENLYYDFNRHFD